MKETIKTKPALKTRRIQIGSFKKKTSGKKSSFQQKAGLGAEELLSRLKNNPHEDHVKTLVALERRISQVKKPLGNLIVPILGLIGMEQLPHATRVQLVKTVASLANKNPLHRNLVGSTLASTLENNNTHTDVRKAIMEYPKLCGHYDAEIMDQIHSIATADIIKKALLGIPDEVQKHAQNKIAEYSSHYKEKIN